MSNKSVSRWESGSYPDVATLGPLAHALGVTVDDLLGVAPPLRSLGRADWQNWLSFAFAIGGGVLFFLLDLFAPSLVCYLLYLGAMAYGVYLQKHYTYHSKWFHRANLAMNFFVNLQLLGTVFSIVVQLTALNTAWQEVLTPTWRDLVALVPRPVRPAGQLWDGVDTSAPLAAVRPRAHLSHLAVHPQQAGRRAPAGRAPAGARPLRLVQAAPGPGSAAGLPVLVPLLVPEPARLDVRPPARAVLWTFSSGGPVHCGLASGRQTALDAPACLACDLLCLVYPTVLDYGLSYSTLSGSFFPEGRLNQIYYLPFGQPTGALFILGVALMAAYLLCCFVRLTLKKPAPGGTA